VVRVTLDRRKAHSDDRSRRDDSAVSALWRRMSSSSRVTSNDRRGDAVLVIRLVVEGGSTKIDAFPRTGPAIRAAGRMACRSCFGARGARASTRISSNSRSLSTRDQRF
jgi:hypothetical protein